MPVLVRFNVDFRPAIFWVMEQTHVENQGFCMPGRPFLFFFPFPFSFLDPGSFTRLLNNLSGGLGYWEMRL